MQQQLLAEAKQAGIATHFINMEGKEQVIDAQVLRTLVQLLSVSPQSDRPLPVVQVFTQGQPCQLAVNLSTPACWQLQLEQGECYQGQLVSSASQLRLPAGLPPGYHQLTLQSAERQWHTRVIIAPRHCFEAEEIIAGHKLWGVCLQLYTLRSRHNWGIGDFGDLQLMIREIAHRGGAFIGLNPLHALYPAFPERASPYSPSSRRWLNMIYIDLNQIPDFSDNLQAQIWWRQKETQQQLHLARESDRVDYMTVMALKQQALQQAFHHFRQRPTADESVICFNRFITEQGESLYRQALFDALQLFLRDQGHSADWQTWPEHYQRIESQEVKRFSQQHHEQIQFYQWVQWVAQRQLDACSQLCRELKMPIGLYRDLAVGVAQGGAETWAKGELYCMQATIGAPPDKLGPLGQDWQLPPLHPHLLQQRGYQPFIDLLRANMSRAGGALRLDHVMGLMRLWWIPAGEGANKGAYVHYPLDDLLAILALESQRQRCMVIGEDLGIVPAEIVSKLRQYAIYSYKVLYFEQQGGHFRAPETYPVRALATITTHDLPTLKGYWQQDDLQRGTELGFYANPVIRKRLYQERTTARQGLLDALHNRHFVPQRCGRTAQRSRMTPLLNRGIQRYIAASASALIGVQPEEWLDVVTPVNIPGTVSEYPNWRRKLPVTLEEMFASARVEWQLKDLNRYRQRAGQLKKGY